jgi:signal transduction histidine kinase
MTSLWQTWQTALSRRLPEHLRESRTVYVLLVMALALLATVASVVFHPEGAAAILGVGFSLALVLLLRAFLLGMSLRRLMEFAALLGLAYMFLSSLVDGSVHSSTLAWLPLVPLAIFYAVSPAAGRIWVVVVLVLQVLMAGVSWIWGPQLPTINTPDLPMMSLIDNLLATLALFLVPYFYQKQHERLLMERQARQHRLEQGHAELAHTVQMREHFIAMVSHELRTPMNAILGLNMVLLSRVQDKPQARRVLEYTRQSADHLMTVINDVLDYSQFSSGPLQVRLERVALHETVRAAFDLFLPRIESSKLHYVCDIAPDVPEWVETDRHRLMQVLVNLLGNAIKFTPHGQIRLQLRRQDQGIAFEVQDTGIGIAAEEQTRIFEHFRQADASIRERFGGSGLGLAISQRLVQMLGGTLSLQSEVGVGSRFMFWLPLQQVLPPQAVNDSGGDAKALSTQALRFLLVDDTPVNRLLVRLVLQRHWPQAEVVEAGDGAQALLALAQPGLPAFDLVLMDMVMPVMDGIEATRSIRSSTQEAVRRVPVLGLTANVSEQDLRRFEQAGLSGLLLKPFEVEDLRREVQRLVSAQAMHPGPSPS